MVTHAKGLFPVLSFIVVTLVILSCATIMHGTSQDVEFSFHLGTGYLESNRVPSPTPSLGSVPLPY